MREFCLTEEVVQQFVDGELSQEQTEAAAAHLAGCEDCARLLDNVEQETAVLRQAFAPELSLTVPTANLRERLDAAIAELEPRGGGVVAESSASRVRNWFGSLFGSFSFTPQQALGFASLAVVIAFAAVFAVIQLRQGGEKQTTMAGNQGAPPVAEKSPERIPDGKSPEQIADGAIKDGPVPSSAPDAPTAATAGETDNQSQRRNAVKRPGRTFDIPKPSNTPSPAPSTPRLLPGEEGYLKAIVSLTNAIEVNKDDVLKPTVRADYERSLAVVDQAIASTRQQAKRNPNDRDAVEFMYMAYQNKIELLSAVADQTRLASR